MGIQILSKRFSVPENCVTNDDLARGLIPATSGSGAVPESARVLSQSMRPPRIWDIRRQPKPLSVPG